MSIENPYEASAFGAMDSVAYADGAPLGGPKVRTPIGMGNRLKAKEQALGTLLWPKSNTLGTEVALGDFEGVGWLAWRQVLPPFPIPKRAMSQDMQVKLRAKISDDHTVYFQLVTIAAPFFSPQSSALIAQVPNVITCLGDSDNDFDVYTASAIPLARVGLEWATLFVKGVETDDNMETGTYGTPQSGTQTQDPTNNQGWTPQSLIYGGANTWAASGPNPSGNIAAGGHYIEFTDSIGGNIGVTPRDIVSSAPGYIQWWPPLDPVELQRVRSQEGFRIKKSPTWSVSSLAMKANAVAL